MPFLRALGLIVCFIVLAGCVSQFLNPTPSVYDKPNSTYSSTP